MKLSILAKTTSSLVRLGRSFIASFKMFISLDIWKNRVIFLASLASIILLAAIGFILKFKLPGGEVFLTLHYTALGGIDYIGSREELNIIPGLAAVFLIINIGLSIWFFKKNQFFAQIIAVATLLILALFLIAGIAIVRINIG